MTPPERIQLPLNWRFIPLEQPADRSIRWKWRAYTQGGRLAMESEQSFESLTECMQDAKAAGYGA